MSLAARTTQVGGAWRFDSLICDLGQTAVISAQIRSISDLRLPPDVTQDTFEKIGFHVTCLHSHWFKQIRFFSWSDTDRIQVTFRLDLTASVKPALDNDQFTPWTVCDAKYNHRMIDILCVLQYNILMLAEDFSTDQSLQHPAVCLWRVTGLTILLWTSLMNLDLHAHSMWFQHFMHYCITAYTFFERC